MTVTYLAAGEGIGITKGRDLAKNAKLAADTLRGMTFRVYPRDRWCRR